MRARVVIIALGALFVASCADRPFGPVEDPITERFAPPLAGAHSGQQFRISPVALDFGQVPVGTTAPEQFVVITNVGHGAVTMSGTGGGAGVFGGVQNCQGTTLAEGASCVIAYAFQPAGVGLVQTTVTGTWNDQDYTIALRGEGVRNDRFAISPAALDFGQVNVGETSAAQTVTVTNRGPGPILMDGTGGGAGEFGGSQNCQGTTLAEGASCQMTYEFTPTGAGVATGTAAGTWNGQSYSIALRGEGMQRQRFAIRQTILDFGEVYVNSGSQEIVQVTNMGPGPVTVTGTMGSADGFMTMQMCEGVTLAEGQSCPMYYIFTPTAAGTVATTTSGNWNGQAYSIELRATVLEQGTPRTKRFRIMPRGIDFGQVAVGSSSTAQTVQVVNFGSDAVVMSGSSVAAGVFGGTTNCQGATLQPGGACTMTFSFTPTAAGVATHVLNGTWNGEAYAIEFRGYGVQRERFLITPTAFDFGDVRVGESSAEHVIRIINMGPGSVVMDGTGGGAQEFGGTQNCQGATLAEGAYCEMSYSFTPTQAGDVTRTTNGTWNGQPFSFTFRGSGVALDRFLISPVGFDFGEVPVGTTSAEQSVTITNLGPGAVTMDGSGGAAGLFGGSQNCQGTVLAEGASCVMSYSFTPDAAGTFTGSTSGEWNGQAFSLSFQGVGVPPISADIRFGGFLPPFNKRPKLLPGMTLPVKARLLDANNAPLADAEAAALAEDCAVIVTFSAEADKPLCARYSAEEKHFQVNLKIPRLIALGTYRVTLHVRVNDVVAQIGEAEVEIRGR